MTISEAYSFAVEYLDKKGIENASFEADCLFEKIFGSDRISRINHPDIEVDFSLVEEDLKKRVGGMPLQYILGSWGFYGYEYAVGEGVLIPRPETELLVEKAAEFLKGKHNSVVFDLCAGTGCIGLSLARQYPSSEVYLFEKSQKAFEYLLKNKEGVDNAFAVNEDIFTCECQKYKRPDLLISNPPYIKSEEISLLQTEVLYEPSMALDGGEDGLDFYRLIGDKWLPLLNENGAVCVECGEQQSRQIEKILSRLCKRTYCVNDYNGIERIVIGEK